MKYVMIAVLLTLSIGTFFFLTKKPKEYQVSTRVLDINIGKPAPDIDIELFKQNDEGDWISIQQMTTKEDGRGHLLPKSTENTGVYKLRYFVESYFQTRNQETVFPYFEVNIVIDGDQYFHIPITFSGNGYAPFLAEN